MEYLLVSLRSPLLSPSPYRLQLFTCYPLKWYTPKLAWTWGVAQFQSVSLFLWTPDFCICFRRNSLSSVWRHTGFLSLVRKRHGSASPYCDCIYIQWILLMYLLLLLDALSLRLISGRQEWISGLKPVLLCHWQLQTCQVWIVLFVFVPLSARLDIVSKYFCSLKDCTLVFSCQRRIMTHSNSLFRLFQSSTAALIFTSIWLSSDSRSTNRAVRKGQLLKKFTKQKCSVIFWSCCRRSLLLSFF